MIRTTKRSSLLLAAMTATALTGTANAGEQFVDKSGVANFGYDVVAYHTTFTPTKGDSAFTATYNGAPFWFTSAENRDRFAATPEAFVPGYDGHCAYALIDHKKLTVDPEAFSIVDPATGQLVDPASYTPGDGQLYLNYDPGVNRKFNKDIDGSIAKASFAWDDCLELRPAAKPSKGFRDLFSAGRPKDCPTG